MCTRKCFLLNVEKFENSVELVSKFYNIHESVLSNLLLQIKKIFLLTSVYLKKRNQLRIINYYPFYSIKWESTNGRRLKRSTI